MHAVEACAVGPRRCSRTPRMARAMRFSKRLPWAGSALTRAAVLVLSLICLLGGTSGQALASSGCNAVNAGQWNLNFTDSSASASGNFLAGDILHVGLNGGGGFAGYNAIYSFSGSLQAGGSGGIDAPVNYSFTATTGSGTLYATTAGLSGDEFTSIITCTPAPPVVTSISPTAGSTAGTTQLTITGTSLTGATYLMLPCTVFPPGYCVGSIDSGIGVTPISDTSMLATLPAGGTAGTIDVIVVTETFHGCCQLDTVAGV